MPKDPERLARFTREAQTLAALKHPNIAHIYGLEESEDVRALIMELVEGEDLAQRMRREPISIAEGLLITRQIADALGAAHEHGIVHRDLKPANVMVGPRGAVKLLDFGLARRMDTADNATAQTEEAMTQPGVLLGTPAYMAPEVLVGRPADARGDIWALGVIIYELATGALPFTGPTPVEFASSILKETPAPLPPHVSPCLREIIRRCLAKDLGQRYQTAQEVQSALDAATLEHVGVARRWSRISARAATWGLAGVLTAALMTALIVRQRGSPVPTPTAIQSLAVLPLENLSPDPEQEYFADGMTDQLIADLSSIPTLRVISRTSVMQYKRARKPLSAIARELNVDAVVEGVRGARGGSGAHQREIDSSCHREESLGGVLRARRGATRSSSRLKSPETSPTRLTSRSRPKTRRVWRALDASIRRPMSCFCWAGSTPTRTQRKG